MKPAEWVFDQRKQEALATRIQDDEAMQRAVIELWEHMGDRLLAVANGMQMQFDEQGQPHGPFLGGIEPALHTALSAMLIFALYNEDPSWLPLSERLTVVGPGSDPRLQALAAKARLQREDPRRG